MKKIILFLAAVLILFSYGCGLLPQEKPSLIPEKVEYHKGTKGIVVKVIENMPADEVWAGNDFMVGLELKNEGAYDVKEGMVGVSGFNPEFVFPSEDTVDFELAGKSPGNPTGDYKIEQFRFSNINYPEGKESIKETFKVSVGYEYETEATAVVCIDPDILGLTKSVCRVGEVSLSGGQGAPIEVTRVEESISSLNGELEVNFVIFFRNAGKGEVFEDTVIILDAFLGGRQAGEELDCGEPEIMLRKGIREHKIKCSAKIKKTQGAYTTPLVVRLGYVYIEHDHYILKIVS